MEMEKIVVDGLGILALLTVLQKGIRIKAPRQKSPRKNTFECR